MRLQSSSRCLFPLFQLRYNENVIAVGAQTERRGDAWPVRGLLGGKDLAGRFLSGVRHQESERVNFSIFFLPNPQPVSTLCERGAKTFA